MKYVALLAVAFLAGCVSQYTTNSTTTTIADTTTTTTSTTSTTSSTTTTLPVREELFRERELNLSECNEVSQLVIEKFNVSQVYKCSAEEITVDNHSVVYVTLNIYCSSPGGMPTFCPTFNAIVYNNSAYESNHDTWVLTEKEKITKTSKDKSYDITLDKVLDKDSASITVNEETINLTRGMAISIGDLKIFAKDIFFYGSKRTDNQMLLMAVITPEILSGTSTTSTSLTTTTTLPILPMQLFRELNQTECWNVSRTVIEKYNLTGEHTCLAEDMMVGDKRIIYITLLSGGCPATSGPVLNCPPVISFDAVVYNNSVYKLKHSEFLTEKEVITTYISGRLHEINVKDIFNADSATLLIDGNIITNVKKGEFFNISESTWYVREIYFYGSQRTDNQIMLKIIITPEFLASLNNA